MDRLAHLWADYEHAPVPEWNHPINARDFLRCIKRFQKDWYEEHINEQELKSMINRSTQRLVWIPPKFHEASRIETGLYPLYKVIEDNRRDASNYLPFLSFVGDIDLTTFENRCIHLPFSSDFYYLMRGQLFDFARKNLNFDRLAWVKQLAYMGLFNSLREKGLPDPNPHYALPHSRMQHSLLVSSLMEVVMTRLGIPEPSITEAAFAAMLHDIATPGLGDTMKKLDKEGLNEETHLCDVVKSEAQKLMKDQLGIHAQRIFNIVNGSHPSVAAALLHSRELDLDKIAYTSLDTNHFLLMCEYDLELPDWHDKIHTHLDVKHLIGKTPPLYHHIKEILSAHPTLFDIYKDVEVVQDRFGKEKVVFSDHEKVYHVLKLRALLSTHLYMSRESRAKEAGYFFHLFSPLYNRGVFRTENLRHMTDREAAFTLMATIAELEGLKVGYGRNKKGLLIPYQTKESDIYIIDMGVRHAIMRYFKPMTAGATPYSIEQYESEEAAKKAAQPFGTKAEGVYVRNFKGYHIGENTLVKDGNNIVPLHCVRSPSEIAELVALRDQTRGWFVFRPNPKFKELFGEIKELHAKAASTPRGNEYPPTDWWQ